MASSPLQVGEDVAKTMAAMSKALDTSTKAALRKVGAGARKTMLARAAEVPGSDRRFSRMARYNHAGRLGVTVRVRDDHVFVGSKGPWKIAEVGAAPHRVRGGQHPGTARSQGRRAWSRGADVALAEAEKAVPKAIGDAVEEAFRG